MAAVGRPTARGGPCPGRRRPWRGRSPPTARTRSDFRVNPDYQEHADLRRALAEETGFTLFQEKEGFRWSADVPEPERRAARLSFRSIDEVGRDLFAHTMGRATPARSIGSIATTPRSSARTAGAARCSDTSSRRTLPSWRLAFTPDGEPAGYVNLSGFDEPGRATIAHIGVVPEQRGNGYVDELLGEYNRLARERGFTSSISDVDVENVPMRAAMERNGHRSDATRLARPPLPPDRRPG